MSQVPIPPSSLERLRQAYSQFEQIAVVVAEALNIPPEAARHLDLVHGYFETESSPSVPGGGLDSSRTNGVPV